MNDRIIRMKELVNTVGLCRAIIYRHIKAGKFPSPLKLGTASGWRMSEIQQWMDERASDRKPQ